MRHAYAAESLFREGRWDLPDEAVLRPRLNFGLSALMPVPSDHGSGRHRGILH